MSTGLFPQEILLQLTTPSAPRSIRIVSSNVRQVIVEGCEGNHPGNFSKIGETELGSNSGDLQRESIDLSISKPINFIKVMIMLGWDEFVSVHSLKID